MNFDLSIFLQLWQKTYAISFRFIFESHSIILLLAKNMLSNLARVRVLSWLNGNDHDLTVTNCRYHSSQVSPPSTPSSSILASSAGMNFDLSIFLQLWQKTYAISFRFIFESHSIILLLAKNMLSNLARVRVLSYIYIYTYI